MSRPFPFAAMGQGMVDHIKTDVGTAFPETKLVKHDDHWLRPTNVANIAAKSPVFYIAFAGSEFETAIDVDSETQWDIFWIAAADLVGTFRGSASSVAAYLCQKFTDDPDRDLPQFTAPSGFMIKDVEITRAENYNELLEFGLVGVKVTVTVTAIHAEP